MLSEFFTPTGGVIATVVLWVASSGLWFLAGWHWGRAGMFKKFTALLKDATEAMRRDNDWDHAESMQIDVNDEVIMACKSLRPELFISALAQQGVELPGEAAEGTMHMIRSGHPKFSQAEKEWSRAWLEKNGAIRHPSGAYTVKGGGPPTIN